MPLTNKLFTSNFRLRQQAEDSRARPSRFRREKNKERPLIRGSFFSHLASRKHLLRTSIVVESSPISNDSPFDSEGEGKKKKKPEHKKGEADEPQETTKNAPPCRCPRTSTACPSRRGPGSPARTRPCAGSRESSGTGKELFPFFFFPLELLSLFLLLTFFPLLPPPPPKPQPQTLIKTIAGRPSPSASRAARASSAPSAGATSSTLRSERTSGPPRRTRRSASSCSCAARPGRTSRAR